jgi:AraC-like DNA-binding protein
MEEIHPFIRIAHHLQHHSLNVPRRIIFDYEFVLVLAGEGQVIFDHRSYKLGPHGLFFIAPFLPHRIETPGGLLCDHVAVHFDFAPNVPFASRQLSRRAPYEVRLPGALQIPPRIALMANDIVEREFLELIEARSSGTAWANLKATACLQRILAALFERVEAERTRGSAEHYRNRVRIERVLSHVGQHLAEPTNSATLARIGSMSLSHFNRLFREWTGYSPLDYLRRQRIARARQLLADVDLSIKEVAARSGFKDPYHFSKAFRQLDGLSPSQFRDAALAGKRA